MNGYISCLCIFLFIIYSSYPGRVRRLERKVKRLKNKEDKLEMSKVISGLVGKNCRIVVEGAGLDLKCKVLEADEEWVMTEVPDKKNNKPKTKIVRIDDIREIEILD